MTERKTLYLSEALWITASMNDRASLSSLSGGGGPGYGGWGLSEGRPRGTSKFTSNIGEELAWQRIMGAEQQGSEQTYAERYAPLMAQLSEQIKAERSALQQKAIAEGGSPLDTAERTQQLFTSQLQQRRTAYLQLLPKATGFYGAIAFYKRFDSFFTRINDPEVFPMVGTGETWTNNIYQTFDDSLDASYKLHLEAEKLRELVSALPDISRQLDTAELAQHPVDLLKVIARRTTQIQLEQQICFDCLPNFIQHELVQAAPAVELGLAEYLTAFLQTSNTLVQAKQTQVPIYTASNLAITGPLSKPQLEALQHLVDEQAKHRAGPLWADYHRALSLTESIRHLQWFNNALTNLQQRATEVKDLQARYQAELAAEQASHHQAEADRNRIRYASAATAPAIIPIGTASFAIVDSAYTALRESVRAAVSALFKSAITSTPSMFVATVAMLWPSSLGNSERRYLMSIPLADLSPPDGPDLAAMAASANVLDLPYLLAGAEQDDRVDLYVVPGGKPVPIRAATYDSERQLYSLALENPQRILTWTPASAPGAEAGSSTSLPQVPPGTVVYTGSSLNPVSNAQEGYPALDLLDQDRLIITFPMDSGLPPILVVFKSPRYEAGTSIGTGAQVTDTWRDAAASREGAPIPAQISDLLRGKEFRNFDAFRQQFWRAVANDPQLSKQFREIDLARMKKHGYSPTADFPDSYLSQKTFILHHIIPISEGGGVYDMDNLSIVTPLLHNKIHYKTKP